MDYLLSFLVYYPPPTVLTAKLVWGLTLRLPAEFLSPSASSRKKSSDFLQQLRNIMQSLSPTPAFDHNKLKLLCMLSFLVAHMCLSVMEVRSSLCKCPMMDCIQSFTRQTSILHYCSS